MKVTYYINGTDFATYGVKVSGSRGLLDGLKMKDITRITWPDHHGEVVDLAAPRYESRTIHLECWIAASGSTAFILAVQSFLAAFQKSGLQRLMVDIDDSAAGRKPLVYEVYMEDVVDINKKWNETKMIGTFSITLKEPEPVKRVYSFEAESGALDVSFLITTDEPVNIYWGDGDNDLNVDTDSGEVVHSYASEGLYYIILTGVIEDINSATTTATLVWSRL